MVEDLFNSYSQQGLLGPNHYDEIIILVRLTPLNPSTLVRLTPLNPRF